MQRGAFNILRRDTPRPANVLDANLPVDISRKLLALYENASLEILVVLEAPEVEIRGSNDDPPHVEHSQLQMAEVVLVLEDLQPGFDVRGVVVLLSIVGHLVWGPRARRDDESHVEEWALPLGREERFHDRGVIKAGVFDEDRMFRSKNAVKEGLPDLIGSRTRFALDHPRGRDAYAARRCRGHGVEGPEVRAAVEQPALAEDPVEVADDRSLEPSEAVVPLPPGFRLTRFPRGGRLVVRVLLRIEGHTVLVLGPEVRGAAVRDAAINGHDLPVINVKRFDRHGPLDIARKRVELGLPRLDDLVVVELRIDYGDAGVQEALAHLRDIGGITGEARILLHHLLLAGPEGVPHVGLLNIQEYTDGDARARFRLEDTRDHFADRIVEEKKNGDVDGSRRGVKILKKYGEESISVYEVLDEVHTKRIAHRGQRALKSADATRVSLSRRNTRPPSPRVRQEAGRLYDGRQLGCYGLGSH